MDSPRGAAQSALLDGAERQRLAGFARSSDGIASPAHAARCVRFSLVTSTASRKRLFFKRDAHGRPRLAGRHIDFNVAHSGNLALIAIGTGPGIGIDIEALREVKDVLTLSQPPFSGRRAAEVESAASA